MIKGLIVGLAMLVTSTVSQAAIVNFSFRNSAETNSIWLWEEISTTSFRTGADGITFSGDMADWTRVQNASNFMQIAGTTADPLEGLFTISFNMSNTKSKQVAKMQWAEVFFDGVNNTLIKSGTIQRQGLQTINTLTFTHQADIPNLILPNARVANFAALAAPVPVPAAVWLLGSALGAVGLMRRRIV